MISLEKRFGPDDNEPLNYSMVSTISVPKGYKASFNFVSEAAWEQAICIYDSNEELVVEKGTYGRDMLDWETPINNAAQQVNYKVTGWHKETPHSANKDWIESPYRRFPHPDGSITIGFNDSGNDSDYNDITATYRLV